MEGHSVPVNLQRHSRHILLKEIGGPGQAKLAAARVVMIGAGGLGAPALLYLAAAGVGHIRIVDPDHVSLDNLQRQILYQTSDEGQAKVDSAAQRLQALDPDIKIDTHHGPADADSLDSLLRDADLVLDGTDSFPTRFAVNRAAITAQIPLISGAVGRWGGQVSVFATHLGSPCYRCFVPDTPPDIEPCGEVGIVGALTGIIGSTLALEAIKIITNAGTPLLGRVMIFDGLTAKSRTVTLHRDPKCPECSEI